jgi:CheY-like chemotaxis protein
MCVEAGMDDFLGKPIIVEDLRTMVEKWTAGAAKELAT